MYDECATFCLSEKHGTVNFPLRKENRSHFQQKNIPNICWWCLAFFVQKLDWALFIRPKCYLFDGSHRHRKIIVPSSGHKAFLIEKQSVHVRTLVPQHKTHSYTERQCPLQQENTKPWNGRTKGLSQYQALPDTERGKKEKQGRMHGVEQQQHWDRSLSSRQAGAEWRCLHVRTEGSTHFQMLLLPWQWKKIRRNLFSSTRNGWLSCICWCSRRYENFAHPLNVLIF